MRRMADVRYEDRNASIGSTRAARLLSADGHLMRGRVFFQVK